MNCEDCQIGHYQPESLTYMHALGRHVVVLPNAPGVKCDVCGHTQIDPRFLLHMRFLFEESARDRRRNERRQPSFPDLTFRWRTAVQLA